VIEMLLQADRLLTVDMVDQADTIYRRVAEQDPRNAIAVVGMARCALARGEDPEAYRLAARALAIDPENDMARRMTARMAEVLTYRGDALPDTTSPTRAPGQASAPATGSPGVATSQPSVATTEGPARSGSQASGRSWLDRIRGR
jgi:thioredoxin-like negative regulator of GroEL